MKVRCVKAFGSHEPGDELEVPDGSSVSEVHFEPVAASAPPPAATPAARPADTPKAGA